MSGKGPQIERTYWTVFCKVWSMNPVHCHPARQMEASRLLFVVPLWVLVSGE